MPTREEVYEALRQVEDPELGMDIVELGLLYDVEVSGRTVKVTHSLTSMGCPAGPMIQEDINRVAREVPGVEDVDIELTWDPPWTPERMSDDAKFILSIGLAMARRIAVVGVSGNGKTTFARRLAAKLDVPYTELDALHHLPGWVEAGEADFRREVEAVMNRSEGWVLDGSYMGKLGDLILRRADTIVWLDQPLPLVLRRLVKRAVTDII